MLVIAPFRAVHAFSIPVLIPSTMALPMPAQSRFTIHCPSLYTP